MVKLVQKLQEKLRQLPVKYLVILFFFLACFTAFLLIMVEMVIEKENNFDGFIFRKVSLITTPALTRFMAFITHFGSLNFLLPAYVVLIVFDLYIKDKKLFLYIIFIGICTTGLLFGLKFLFKRMRPSDPLLHAVNGFSFPSGHSFSSFTFFGILIYIIWKDTKLKGLNKWLISILLFGVAFTIALSRVYLHVHYASDVIAGFCLSVICLTLSYWVLKTITSRQLKEIKIPDVK